MVFWFTSDYHFGHDNIIKYCNRPFKNIHEMNSAITRNHNSRVKPDDTVLFLGDFCFKGKSGPQTYLEKLNGNFVFIRGNHDNNNSLNAIIENVVINHGGQEIFLTHRPVDFDPAYKLNLVGHVHEKWKKKVEGKTTLINVGADVWNFMPINIQEILKEVNRNEV